MVLDGYIRVSQVRGRKGERFISPKVQKEEILRWMAAHGAELGEMFEELNQSGLRADRPRLMEAIERVESGASDGIVVAKLNRFGRSLLDGLSMIERIQKAGGTLVSVQQGFDLRTSTGQLVARILFAVAEWEVDQWRDHWQSAREQAIDRGVYLSRRAPLGYRKTKRGHLEIDPVAGPVIRELFELRLNGSGVPSLVEFLNDSEIETESGRPFSWGSVYAMLRNSAYCGSAHSGPYSNPSAHAPIIDPAQWQLCQRPPRTPNRWVEALISGRIRCSNCGASMSAIRHQGGKTRANVYQCGARPVECDYPARAPQDELDPLVEEFIFRHSQLGRPLGDAKTRRHEAAVAQAQEDVVTYRDNVPLQRTLGPDSFEAGLAKRAGIVERRLLELGRAKQAKRARTVDLRQAEADWPKMSWEQRRKVAADMIDLVVVERGHEPVIERAWIFRKGNGPVVNGQRRRIAFVKPKGDKSRLKELKPWGEKRLERELRLFFADRDGHWPHYIEFAKCGRARLHAQAMAWGGPHFWGHRLGLSIPIRTVRWSPRTIKAALDAFLRDRDTWPTMAEFREAGLEPLDQAIRCNGGNALWAEKYGLPHRPSNSVSARRVWTDGRIEQELVAFLKGRDFFPSGPEFSKEGKLALHSALVRYGGVSRWADRFNLQTAPEVRCRGKRRSHG